MWVDPSSQTKIVDSLKNLVPAFGTTIVSVVGGLGSVIAFAKTGKDLLQNRSLVAKRNSELERAGRFADLLEKFSCSQVAKEHQEALGQSVQDCLQQCLANVEKLNARLAELNRDPNSRLKIHEKLFLAFRPVNWRGWVLLVLTYAALGWCGWYIFHSGVAGDTGKFSKQVFLAALGDSFRYLVLAFSIVVLTVLRAWALEERRRSLGFRTDAGRLGRWLVMRFPESGRMLLAQTMFFLTGMALLMIIHGAITGANTDRSFMVFVGIVLLVRTLILRAWALAELAYQQRKPPVLPWKKVLFAGFFKHLPRYGLWRILSLMSLGWFAFLVLIVLFLAMFIAGSPSWVGALIVIVFPLPDLILIYGVLRSLRIKYALTEEVKDQPQSGLALQATA